MDTLQKVSDGIVLTTGAIGVVAGFAGCELGTEGIGTAACIVGAEGAGQELGCITGTFCAPGGETAPTSAGDDPALHDDPLTSDPLTSDPFTESLPGGKCSFDGDTPVLMADGSAKPIAKVQVGDKVETGDPSTGKDSGGQEVQHLWLNHDNDLVDVQVLDQSGADSVLHTTANHPFWDDTTKTWTPAGALKAGDRLASTAGHEAIVQSVVGTPGTADRYNLTVAQLHTYYVVAGDTPVLVHNSSCGVLNLGSGGNAMPDAVNVDIKAGAGVDVVADANALPFVDGAFDSVHSVNPYSFNPVNAETARVMKPGGILMVTGQPRNGYAFATAEQAEAAGFKLVSTGPMDPAHDFGVQLRGSGQPLDTSVSITSIYVRN